MNSQEMKEMLDSKSTVSIDIFKQLAETYYSPTSLETVLKNGNMETVMYQMFTLGTAIGESHD